SMTCRPALNCPVVVVSTASSLPVPALNASVELPSMTGLFGSVTSVKIAVPVGTIGVLVLGGLPATVAVNVTVWGKVMVVGLTVTVVVVAALVTVWLSVVLLLVVKLALPLKRAVTSCMPTLSVLVVKVATPFTRFPG